MQVFIIAALSADGFIAKAKNQISTSWTSKADKKFFVTRTKQAGVCIFGRKTYATFGRPLPHRLNIIYTDHPKTVPSSQPLSKKSLSEFPAPPAGRSISTPYTTTLSPKKLIQSLKSQDHQQAAICGGASIYSLFLASGVVTKLYLTIEPILFGQGISLFNQKFKTKLHLEKLTKLSSQTTLLELSLPNKS